MNTNGRDDSVRALGEDLTKQIHKVFVGKESAIHHLIVGFISGLHVLIEDIPGLGKTTLAMSLAKSAGLDFGRIQFTPDILPGDILGMTIWSVEKHDFVFKPGGIMHQFILADEINRASARTQSSLLEAMQERAVTVDGNTYPLPSPFFVVATQNPVSFTGTFLLPESQTDRFGISLSLGYPPDKDETVILERFQEENPLDDLGAVTGPEAIIEARKKVRSVRTDSAIKEYLVKIAEATRKSPKIRLGMSPRATQHLLLASQAEALLSGRSFVIPEDVLSTAPAVLNHRLVLSAEAKIGEQETGEIIDAILARVPVPSGVK